MILEDISVIHVMYYKMHVPKLTVVLHLIKNYTKKFTEKWKKKKICKNVKH